MPSDTPSLTLYQLNGTCAFAAHALLLELGIPFTRVRMSRSDAGLFTSSDGSFDAVWYKANIHHLGLVPALVVDGKTLTENPAVLSYIAGLKPERKLLGRGEWEKAKVLEWMAWLSGMLHGQGVAAFLRPFRFTDEEGAFEGGEEEGFGEGDGVSWGD